MDSIASYEEKATSQPSMHESAMTAFSSSLDRVQQVEALHRKYWGVSHNHLISPSIDQVLDQLM